MGLFGTLIRPRTPAVGGGLSTQSVGLSSTPTPIARLTVPVMPAGTYNPGVGVVITLIPPPTTSTTTSRPTPGTVTPGARRSDPSQPGGVPVGPALGSRGAGRSGAVGTEGGSGGTYGASIARTLAGGRGVGPIAGPALVEIRQFAMRTVGIAARIPRVGGDVLDVSETSLRNGQFYPIMDSGVHKFRPEIILNSEFNTIWEPGEVASIDGRLLKKKSSTGDFINFQFQTKQLRQETVAGLIKNIQKTLSNPDIFQDVKKDYTEQLAKVGQDLGYLENIVSNVAIIKNAFNIKNIPIESYESKSGEVITRIRTLRQLFNEKMQYRTDQFDIFSNTKIILQLLFDLENMLSAYSVNLLSLTDADRRNDASPIRLDRTYTTKNGAFSFTINNFSSISTVVNAGGSSFFTTFMASLPPAPNDRIKLLTYLLAKEYSVSRGLGNSSNGPRLQGASFAPGTGGSPFKNIIGIPGDTIFENSIGIRDSLASLVHINPDSPNVKILTFENKFVDSNDQRFTYIPGTSFFTDAILTVDGQAWNSNALTEYVNRYNTIVRNVRTLVNDVFSFDESATATETGVSNVESSVIDPVDMNKRLLMAIRSSYGALAPAESAVLEDLTNFSSNIVQKRLLLEEQIRFINAQIETATNETSRSAYNTQIAAVRSRLNGLSLPALDDNLKISLDKATIMAIFKFVSSGHDDIKRLLFQFCLLAGLTRNSPSSNLNDVFSVMAATEIPTTGELLAAGEGGFAIFGRPISTTDGRNLVPLLLTLANELERVLIAALNPALQSASRQYTPEGTLKFYIRQDNISNLLYKCALGEGPAAETNLIYQFVNLVNQFFNSGRIDGVNVHLTTDGSNVTKYNYLSSTTQALFIYETLCQYAAAYGSATFASRDSITEAAPVVAEAVTVAVEAGGTTVGSTTGRATPLPQPTPTIQTLGLAIDFAQMNNMVQALGILTTSTSEEEKDAARRRRNQPFISLESNKNKIAAEYETIKEMLSNLKIIGDHLQSSLTQVQGFFNQTALQEFLRTSPVSNLNLLKNYSQLRLASYIYNHIKERTDSPGSFMKNFGGTQNTESTTEQSDLIVSETTTESEYNSLVSFLSNPNNPSLQCLPSDECPADVIKRNNKILAIGIPAGFSRELADRINKGQINAQAFQEKQSDVVVANVYVRNMKFNDLVFKPLQYVFDLSLFATRKDFVDCNAVNGESIGRILSRISLTDLENPFSPQKIDGVKIAADPKYSFLNTQQKSDLIKNHVASYLLGVYIQFITGVKTTEEIFLDPASPQKTLTTKAKTILDTYVQQTFGTVPRQSSIKDILVSRNLPEKLKDAYRLLAYGSLVFCENEVRSRALTPKLFDRIFYVPVNTNNAEIDYTATMSTAVGRDTWKKLYTQSHIKTNPPGTSGADTKYYLDALDVDDFIINDMFVAVETANDTVAQDSARYPAPPAPIPATTTRTTAGTVTS